MCSQSSAVPIHSLGDSLEVSLPAVKAWDGGNVTTTVDAGFSDRKVSLALINLMLKKTACGLENLMGI